MISQENKKETLTFLLLEDVMNADINIQEKIISSANLYRIGPILEYIYQTSPAKIDLLNKNQSSITNPLKRALNTTGFKATSVNTSLTADVVEFRKCYNNDNEHRDNCWTAFRKRLEDAAKKSGLQENFAKALVGTFDEMTGNLLEHSERAESGLVGYRWDSSEFEYVVADRGIGILNSLRKNTDYSYLNDASEALVTALEYGESRFGNKSGRGTGFNTLLQNIADRKSYLRFRSGDHYYMINGTEGEKESYTRQSTNYNGFLISVVCKSS